MIDTDKYEGHTMRKSELIEILIDLENKEA